MPHAKDQLKLNSRRRMVDHAEVEHTRLDLPDDMADELKTLNVYIDKQTSQVS